MMRRQAFAAVAASLLFGPLPALAEEGAAPLLAQACAGCHGQAGSGQGSVPRLAGYDREQFIRTWEAFRANERPATIMNRIAPGYTDDEVAALADYFSGVRAEQ